MFAFEEHPDRPWMGILTDGRVTADFEGGLISSDGGLVLLRRAERRIGLAETLTGCIREWRDPAQTVHSLSMILRFRKLGHDDRAEFGQAFSWGVEYILANF